MPVLPHQVTPIETLLPAVDHRGAARSFVIDGANFNFDSKGPRSGFTTRVLTPFPLFAPEGIQSIRIQDRTLVFTSDSILAWRDNVPYTWELLYAFNSILENTGRWSAIFVEGLLHLANPERGLFSSEIRDGTQKLWLRPKTDADIPGLIPNIRGMSVVRGRPILVNDTDIQWGAVGDMEDFTPGLGGAGLQALSSFVQGTFLALTSFQDGFAVWTTGGTVVGEFIDGDEVWNFYPIESRIQPISERATRVLEDGRVVVLSKQGIQVASGTKVDPWSPEFNEFFIEYLESNEGRFSSAQYWRVDYDAKRETIYLSESADGAKYWRSFVFNPTRGKWGLFSQTHYGFLSPAENIFGFVDTDGIVNYFDNKIFTAEGEPDNARGLNRHYPRVEKQIFIPSSSAVSRAVIWNPEAEMSELDPVRAGWYDSTSSIPSTGDPKGLNSWIEIGYVRPQELQGHAVTLLEFQTMKISSIPSIPSFPVDFKSKHKRTLLYIPLEDWQGVADIDSGLSEFDMLTEPAEDSYDAMTQTSDSNIDNLNFMSTTITYPTADVEDWNVMTGDEDWNSDASGLSPYTYNLFWLASEDGITFDAHIPKMARFDMAAQVWTGITSGAFHRIRIEALAPTQYYHVSHLDVTLQYGGSLV